LAISLRERSRGYNVGLCWQTLNGLITMSWGTPQSRRLGSIFPRTLWLHIWNRFANDNDPCKRE
jgi:hypothetical protein